jgi:hypothetical protein
MDGQDKQDQTKMQVKCVGAVRSLKPEFRRPAIPRQLMWGRLSSLSCEKVRNSVDPRREGAPPPMIRNELLGPLKGLLARRFFSQLQGRQGYVKGLMGCVRESRRGARYPLGRKLPPSKMPTTMTSQYTVIVASRG